MTRLRRRSMPSLLSAIVVAAALVVGAHVANAQLPSAPNQLADFLKLYATFPKYTVPVSGGGAAVTIVKFTDYQCPGCGATHQAYKPVLEKYATQFPGAVKLIVKDFPLNKDCNPTLMQTIHPASCDAAIAVALARAQNHGPELEDWLYANQNILTPLTVRRAAEGIGGVKNFEGGYAQAIEQVKADASLGRLLGVDSTPTFFFNGTKVARVLQPEYFDAIIAYELRKAGKMK